MRYISRPMGIEMCQLGSRCTTPPAGDLTQLLQ